jgi:pilus assembly protein CpaF
MEDIFSFDRTGVGAKGEVRGSFRATGVQPLALERLKAFGVKVNPAIFQEVHEVRG